MICKIGHVLADLEIQGLPKAAMLSHRNMITQHRLFTDWNATPWQVSHNVSTYIRS